MGDRILLISWGHPIPGREQHSLEVFEQALVYYGELRDGGRIDAFNVILMPATDLMNGCMLLQGSHAQVDAVAEEERFRRLIIDAAMVVEDLRVSEGYTGDAIAQNMALFAEAAGRVPQMA